MVTATESVSVLPFPSPSFLSSWFISPYIPCSSFAPFNLVFLAFQYCARWLKRFLMLLGVGVDGTATIL